MTTGELDYDELYHQEEGAEEIAFPTLSSFIWPYSFFVIGELLINFKKVNYTLMTIPSNWKPSVIYMCIMIVHLINYIYTYVHVHVHVHVCTYVFVSR